MKWDFNFVTSTKQNLVWMSYWGLMKFVSNFNMRAAHSNLNLLAFDFRDIYFCKTACAMILPQHFLRQFLIYFNWVNLF